MKISFHGAAREVTGSCHLVEVAGRRILVECGMLQGEGELEHDNAADFGFEPSGIDALLLTHAHLDHCGRIPLLVRRGFRGEIITTGATRELARLVMLDAASLQEEAAGHRKRKAREGFPVAPPGSPLYTVSDALNAMDRFGRVARYGEPVQVVPGVTATFHDAGHILGSASILVSGEEAGVTRRALFSGIWVGREAPSCGIRIRRERWTWWSWRPPTENGATGAGKRRWPNWWTPSAPRWGAAGTW